MLGVLRWRAILVGIATGTLVSAILFLVGLLIARVTRAEAALPLTLSASLIVGLLMAGFTAGRMAPFNGRFHGSITALGIAAVVVVISRLGGSPAPTTQVLLLAFLAIVLGGIAGWLGGRRSYNGNDEPTG